MEVASEEVTLPVYIVKYLVEGDNLLYSTWQQRSKVSS